MISSFYNGETKRFQYDIRLNGGIPDLSADEVRILVKLNRSDEDVDAVLNVVADIATEGERGRAKFVFSDTETAALTANRYYYEVIWSLNNGDKFILEQGEFKVFARLTAI